MSPISGPANGAYGGLSGSIQLVVVRAGRKSSRICAGIRPTPRTAGFQCNAITSTVVGFFNGITSLVRIFLIDPDGETFRLTDFTRLSPSDIRQLLFFKKIFQPPRFSLQIVVLSIEGEIHSPFPNSRSKCPNGEKEKGSHFLFPLNITSENLLPVSFESYRFEI
ncbi:hypothetical protein CEXT_615181 [Caerostris extrusa]|uniref:Uncharacterized protein n=1 Tax=Caerostris extrusa TaxID=172846 RepID=A0AAV4PRU7_CAEEX|nr:hypothetical protein CEXT_615181 [Caerostris extrusa]